MNQETAPAIGKAELKNALDQLRRCKAAKAQLERRILENEDYWRLRHWDRIPEQGTTGLKTKSAWLLNVLLSKHADAMDAYPEPSLLPRAQDDEDMARLLSAVVPVILQQNDFEKTWSDNWWKKLKAGAAVYGVFWDRTALNGLGDVAVKPVDPLSLYWEPGITDLQQSRNLFHVRLENNETLVELYPVLKDRLGREPFPVRAWFADPLTDVTDKTPVIDWYYKKRLGGRTVLHYVKFVGETVLYATENDPACENGLYDHGLYPFFADVLFPEEGTPMGFGYIDVCKDAQRQIDLMNNAIVANCIAAATPRWLKRGDDGINEEEYADWTRPFVHVQGSIEDSALRQIAVNPLSGNYLNILASKINEIKETSGNRDVNNGGVGGGVTAASAIAAMQEQSGKLSRDQIRNSYRCFRHVVYCVISLIRQFYDVPRQLRIAGPDGEAAFLRLDNRGMERLEPAMLDIEVSAQKQSAYNKLSYNELALQLYGLGFFNPQMADQALTALDMMDFKGLPALRARLRANGDLQSRLEQAEFRLQSLLELAAPAGSIGREEADARQAKPRRGAAPRLKLRSTDSLGGERKPNAIAEKAKARAAAATQPR